MADRLDKIAAFVEYVHTLSGDEKGEAQVFCDRLFQAFGHAGYKEAGAELEYRVKAKGQTTKFADLLWEPRLLLEMKKRGEKLEKHYMQAFEYWLELVPQRPKYVVLCNFDEFWIYDFNAQMREPVDRIRLESLPTRFTALNFLFPENKTPLFDNNQIKVTREAADNVAQVFNRIVERGESSEVAQRFILQCVVALFSEDIGLLPSGIFTELLNECLSGASSYDLVSGLFRQMGSERPAPRNSLYKDVPYFNGGIFSTVEHIELAESDISLLLNAATQEWSKVEPAIFGTLFESSMGREDRHAFGAHYTSESDIQKVLLPTIIRPWRDRIEATKNLRDLLALRQELLDFKVLDPACGSGNFLYVAYRELKKIEAQLLTKIHENFSNRATSSIGTMSLLKTTQFYGIDVKPFAVELAKVTLMLAKKLALDEEHHLLTAAQMNLPLEMDRALPLDNLDENIQEGDALFCEWTHADVIIGNPPYLGSRYIADERGYDYAHKIYSKYPDVPKMADYCVYWFQRTHDALPKNGRAGLVATNTVRQNETRQASLDYLIANGGTITEAVSTQVWSGDASVYVSIVNWIKGDCIEEKKLYTQLGNNPNSPFDLEIVSSISSSLSSRFDVVKAQPLLANTSNKTVFVGQYPYHECFRITPSEAEEMISERSEYKDILFPYMIGRDLVENYAPRQWIIDFAKRDLIEAMKYEVAFERIKRLVMNDVLEKAEKEKRATGRKSTRWTRMAKRWWQFRDYQPGTMKAVR